MCAMRAAEAGLRVVVLERGRRMTPEAYEDIARGKANLFHRRQTPGLVELHRGQGLTAIVGSAVGGGSHIYTGVSVPAPPEVFAHGWPEQINRKLLDPYYVRAEAIIRPSAVPANLSRTQGLEKLGRQLGAEVTRLPLAFDWPEDGNSLAQRPPNQGRRRHITRVLQGGGLARKRTLDRTYLHHAEKAGAEVRPLREAGTITPQGEGYRVAYRRHLNGTWAQGSIRARRVVLAAGTLNTVRLLLACRDLTRTLPRISRALGERFFTNGDSGALLLAPKIELAHDTGPPVTSWVDLWKQDRMYLMETGLVPIVGGPVLARTRLARVWSFGVMGYDDNPGTLNLDGRGRLVHRYDGARGAFFHRRRARRLHDLAQASGGMLLAPPAVIARHVPVTIHPLGGAVMADSPDCGVTDAFGEVFGHKGLYIADASLFPTPTGAAPSMTIAAVAEFVIENLIKKC